MKAWQEDLAGMRMAIRKRGEETSNHYTSGIAVGE